MARGESLKAHELEYIRQNCFDKTDEELATHLKRDVRTIVKARKKLGVMKTKGGKIENLESSPTAVQVSQRMTEEQRKEFFKTQLTNSLYYNNLKEQFSKEEIDFYLEEWASLCLQFEDIVATEKRQIDELIKAEIMGNRILRNIKITEDEIKRLIEEVELLNETHDMEDDETAQERDMQLQALIRTMSAASQGMSIDYQKNVNVKNDLLDQLNARRRDRVDQIAKRGTTFLSLVEAFREKEIRDKQARHMELVRIAKEKKREDWRQPHMFPDGVKDCVLMDEHSNIPELDIVRLSDKLNLVDKFSKEENKKILVVDDEIERCILFQSRFSKNKVDFASNFDKAVVKLNNEHYDLICLDFDLGLDQKGSQVIEYIVKENKSNGAPILIHSMNKDGAEAIRVIASNANRLVEVRRYIDIRDNLENKNA
jgi:CheY-like chemotaxis protein